MKGFRRGLVDMQSTAGAILAELGRYRRKLGALPQVAELAFVGQQNLQNLAAVKNLQTMAKQHAYVHHGSKSGLETVLPGVKVSVFGPPTLEQSAQISTQRAKDKDEFWHLRAREAGFWRREAMAGTLAAARGLTLSSSKTRRACPPHARWLRSRLLSERVQTALELVRILDDVLNNTSVILLFEAGGKSFLFPGDAQIENWSYALQRPADLARLAKVDVYKVGHHGSLNATPRTLWEKFTHRGDASHKDRLVTFLSTMAGKHGSVESRTEVPRRTLVSALRKDSELFDTQDLAAGVPFNQHVFEF